MTRAIILAGGDAHRWQNHLDTPKHLAPVPCADGGTQPLLHRTLGQLRDRGITDIHLIVDLADDHYRIAGTQRHQRQWSITHATPWLTTIDLWNRRGRTIVLLGDWWHSKTSMDAIVDARRGWRHACRLGASSITGQQWSEDAGVSFWPEHHTEYAGVIRHVHQLAAADRLPRGGSWEIWAAMNGIADEFLFSILMTSEVFTLGHRITIPDDGSSDFDSPTDYNTWLAAAHEGKVDLRP